MKRFEHGGDTYGLDVLDFSASLNPLGMPAQVIRALQENVEEFSAYPDPHCRDLTRALAEAEGVPAEQIAITSGASDAFSRIAAARKPHKALVCSPCYSGYEQALRPIHTKVVHHTLMAREDFDVTERILRYVDPELDLIFLCTPNNPTGRVLSRELLCKVARTADRWGIDVVLDECFLDFTGEHSAVTLLDRFPNLVVVKAFTKTFAMAGLRLGYAVCGKEEVADSIRGVGAPWSVSAPALKAGVAALEAPGYLDLTRDYVAAERERLEDALRKLGTLVIPSAANFILFQSPAPLSEALLERGILIRSCDNFRGLDATWYRIAVRTTEENGRLLQALGEVLS